MIKFNKTETVLDSELTATSKGVTLPEVYRAVLVLETGQYPKICIQQPIRGNWHGVGQWYLETLMPAGRTGRAQDALSIDYGQQWSISAGLQSAIQQAALICIKGYIYNEH